MRNEKYNEVSARERGWASIFLIYFQPVYCKVRIRRPKITAPEEMSGDFHAQTNSDNFHSDLFVSWGVDGHFSECCIHRET